MTGPKGLTIKSGAADHLAYQTLLFGDFQQWPESKLRLQLEIWDYHIYPTYWDSLAWANSVDSD